MKSVEFTSRVAPDGRIDVPPDVARQLPGDTALQIVVLWGSNDDDAWRAAGAERMAAAYAPEDSVYEQLIDETPLR